ncbi:MAG: manganese efflux pump MntP family protein [Lancefieldella parvula]|uniref:Putative manganese efflux pump MntP n=1 Tax=Lancefieldella parvula TaxID=1382 RepID=A0A9E7AC49_9ACTN|nr:MAG: manganese efflux pump MntP family protein [Lancefieldella parvula]
MGLLEILMLGVALATDAFSVTISNTFAFDDHRFSRLMRMPLFFGLFQFGMPLAGYFVGGIAAELIEKYAGIVSLVILGFIGSNMLYSGYKALKEDASEEDEEEAQQGAQQSAITLSYGKLVFQAVATAIDAFAVGVSFRAHSVDILVASALFGIITAILCTIALFIGKKLGSLLGDRAEMVGGVVLILIGLKAFFG